MPKRRPKSLSRREAQLMEILWDTDGATAGQVRGHVDDDSAESTVRTLLGSLVKKGYARRVGRSHPYRYLPAVPRERLALTGTGLGG